jgi:hypothetical protein
VRTILNVLQQLQLNKVFAVIALMIVLLIAPGYRSANAVGVQPNNPSLMTREQPISYLVSGQRVESNASDFLYPGKNAKNSDDPTIGTIGPEGKKELMDPTRYPAPKQPIINRSDPNNKILEKTGQAFKDASAFIKDSLESQSNPEVAR